MRKTLSGIVAGLIAAAALAFVPAPAQAATTSATGEQYETLQDLALSIPFKVVVNEPTEHLPFEFIGKKSGNLAGVAVKLQNYSTGENVNLRYVGFGNNPTGTLRRLASTAGTIDFSEQFPMGDYIASGLAVTPLNDPLLTEPMRIDVKRESKSSLNAHRRGRYVTLTSRVQKYDGWNKYENEPTWANDRGAKVRIQRFYADTWQTIATRYVPRSGVVKVTVKNRAPREYRIVTRQTHSAWGSLSRTVTK